MAAVEQQHYSKMYQRTRVAVRYALLPGIIPRVREMFRAPFSVLATLMVDVLVIAALIPNNHPYRRPDQMGTFGVLDVLRVSARHIKWDIRHIDQVIVFLAMMAAMVTFWCFAAVAIVHVAFPPASAMNVSNYLPSLIGNIYSYTQTPNPGGDVALMLLDRTLGVVGSTSSGSFFGSDVPRLCSGANCTPPQFPSPIHTATLALLQFYSTAIFMFTVLFFLYLVATIVIDVAMKGKPLGREINSFWTPIRLVGAIGLLIPLAPQGINSAQYIVLYSAKIGSAFATNAWGHYHQIMDIQMGTKGRNPSGMSNYRYDMGGASVIPSSSPLAAKLQAPDVGEIVRFLHLVATCEYYAEKYNGYSGARQVQGYFYRAGKNPTAAYLEQDAGYTDFVSYEKALEYFDNGPIRIVFGSMDTLNPKGAMGKLEPLCGEMVIPVSSIKDKAGKAKNPGAAMAHELYYNYIMGLFDKTTYPRKLMDGFARQMVTIVGNSKKGDQCRDAKSVVLEKDPTTGQATKTGVVLQSVDGIKLTELGDCNKIPPKEYMEYQVKLFQGIFQVLIDTSNRELASPDNFAISDDILNRGWAASGTWFQHVARLNGDYVTAVRQMPYGAKRPKVMDDMRSMIIQAKPRIADPNKFCDMKGTVGKNVPPQDLELAQVLCRVEMSLREDYGDTSFRPDPNAPQDSSGLNGVLTDANRSKSENFVFKVINTVMGTDFLFSMCRNKDTHPFTQIVTYGRELMEGTIRNVMTGSAIAASGGVVSVGNADMGSSLKSIASAYHAFGSIMFLAGFMLYYILPMLPFIYFFFAMLAWVKAVFEGMIGAPLWAFAHIKLDGNGFGTSGARQGYLLMFEILLRPIITVFALIMGLGIFSASVYLLRETMDMVSSSMGRPPALDAGTCKPSLESLRGIVDVFFFNIFYILLTYMLAMSSFKLIDKVPNEVMRWFGSGPKNSIAKASAASDNAGKSFTSQTYVVVANPMKGLIDQADELIFDASKTATAMADKDGSIKASIQSAVGKDTATRAQEHLLGTEKEPGPVKKWADEHAAYRKQHASLKGQMQEPGLTDKQREKIEEEAKTAERLAKLNDPALLYNEVMNPGSTDLKSVPIDTDEHKVLEKRLLEMRDCIRAARPIMWESMQIHSGGGFVSQEAVHGKIKELIIGARNNALKPKK